MNEILNSSLLKNASDEEKAGIGLGIKFVYNGIVECYKNTPLDKVHTRKALKSMLRGTKTLYANFAPFTDKLYDLEKHRRKEMGENNDSK